MNCNFQTVTPNFEKHMYILCNLKDPDPDPDWIRIRNFLFGSDPNPYKSDPDPKHWR